MGILNRVPPTIIPPEFGAELNILNGIMTKNAIATPAGGRLSATEMLHIMKMKRDRVYWGKCNSFEHENIWPCLDNYGAVVSAEIKADLGEYDGTVGD